MRMTIPSGGVIPLDPIPERPDWECPVCQNRKTVPIVAYMRESSGRKEEIAPKVIGRKTCVACHGTGRKPTPNQTLNDAFAR